MGQITRIRLEHMQKKKKNKKKTIGQITSIWLDHVPKKLWDKWLYHIACEIRDLYVTKKY